MVLINFWATWCPPCRREMPSMERLSQALKGEAFAVLAVDVGEDADTIQAFTSQLDTTPTFPILLDTRSHAMQAWKVAGLPTTFLVDKQGRIVASAIGGREIRHSSRRSELLEIGGRDDLTEIAIGDCRRRVISTMTPRARRHPIRA